MFEWASYRVNFCQRFDDKTIGGPLVAFLEQAAITLDGVRSSILRVLFRVPKVRKIYSEPASHGRVSALVSVAVGILCVFIKPEILFYGGPLLLGVPHMASSFRYSLNTAENTTRIQQAIFLGFALGILAIIQTKVDLFPREVLFPFSIFLGLVFLGFGRLSTVQNLLLATIGAAVGLYAGQFYYFWLFLLFFHNAFAFLVWFKKSKSQKLRQSIIQVFSVLSIGSVFIFLVDLPLENVNPLSAFLFQDFFSEKIGQKLLVIFLLWQSMHYWIWLKGIPDAHAPRGLPVPIRVRLQHWKTWATPIGVVGIFAAVAVFLFFAVHFGVEQARSIYIPLASFHGVFEILAFVSLQMGEQKA